MVKSRSSKISQFVLNTIIIILCCLIVYPFLLVVGASFTDEKALVEFGYNVIPAKFSTAAYRYVLGNPAAILNAYKITFIFSVIRMVLAVLLQAMIAYPLTKKLLKGRAGLSFYLYFTMLFGGGMVPSYILMTQYLHLDDTIWVYIIPALVSPWNIFMMRTFFAGIPNAIIESAYIDGANEYRIFFTMILPLSKPILAYIALTTFLGAWNDWNTSMLYINKDSLISLQYLLQRIMKNLEVLQNAQAMGTDISMLQNASEIPGETVRMAMAVVVAGPALVVFPFFQKYFVRGITVGSVKG